MFISDEVPHSRPLGAGVQRRDCQIRGRWYNADFGTVCRRVLRAPKATPDKSLALSEVSRREWLDEHLDADAETPSITRLEGSRWRGGRLWSYKPGSTVSG